MNFLSDEVYIEKNILCFKNPNIDDKKIREKLKKLKIFRKGPYKLNEIFIPSQWNSFIKWQKLEPILINFSKHFKKLNKQNIFILDIGANNGYYSFLTYFFLKKLNIHSQIILIDPINDFFQQFEFISKFLKPENKKNFEFKTIGWEQIDSLSFNFDLIFCMGILYHHTDPIQILKKIHKKLSNKGVLILETITIQYGSFPIMLIPEKKYAGASGIWFIPNKEAIFVLLRRTNYREIQFHSERFIIEEMQSLEYLQGLKEVIDKQNSKITIEGYPVPHRSFFSAIK